MPTAIAESGAAFDVSTAITGITSNISNVINVTNLVTVIGAGLAIAVPFVVTWFAFRFIYNKAKGGLKKGK